MRRWMGVVWWVVVCCVGLPAMAQVREIDRAKLPQDGATQVVYAQLGEYERYGQSWSDKWGYDVPKEKVVGFYMSSLGELTEAAKASPNNHELQLLTGLVAHFAYNLDVEAAYDQETKSLDAAAVTDGADYRVGWFRGIHECQALHVVAGMDRMLAVEATAKSLPDDFWDDYIACANVAILPGHVMRAVDREVDLGRHRQDFQNVVEIAESRYKMADLTKPIDAHDAWTSDEMGGGRLKFISRLCGISFVAEESWKLQVPSVEGGTCKAWMTPPAKKGQASPTLEVMATEAKEGETLESFARGILENRTEAISELSVGCPVERCVSLALVDKTLYSKDGGAHVLLMTFEREVPRYDGLMFETPQGPPVTGGMNQPVVFRFDPQYRRMPGRIFYAVLLDANARIFSDSEPDWEAVAKSVVVE